MGEHSTVPTGTIVAIDDDPDDLRLIQRLLGKAGPANRIVAFTDALEAMRAFRASRDEVRVVFCDLKMPGMDGFEFLGVVRSEPAFARSRVIIVSSCALESDVERARAFGADGFLEKMPSAPDLIRAMSRPSFPTPGTRQELFHSWEESRGPLRHRV